MKPTKFLTTAVAVALGSLALTSYTNAVTITAGTGPNYIDTEGNVFEMGSLTITSGDTSITILDRNLGATETGTTCSDYNTGACGYFFQWGNNYGFGNPLTKTGTIQIRTNVYSRANPYVSDTFIQGNDNWSINDNRNLRGGAGDTPSNRPNPDYMRQGPCPEGYHIPTYDELNTLEILAGKNGKFANTGFLIPFAGRRLRNASLDILGTGVFLWTSSAFSSYSRALYFNSNGYTNINENTRAIALSIRCIYDSSATDTSILSFNTMGGQRMQGQTVPTGGTGHTPGYNPKKVDYDFLGWYKNEDCTIPFDFNTDIITQNTTIYARWGRFVEPTNADIQVTIGEEVYDELPNTMEVSTEIEEESIGRKPVVGEVKVDFGENVSAKFNKLVQVNIPVEDEEQVIVKVKHEGSSVYNFDGLTLNRNASCNDNGRPTSSQYNGEIITVVDGYASIYTCEASSFVALGLGSGEAIGEVTLTLTAGENTCTLNDYNLGTHNVSSEDQNVSTSGQNIVCEFLKNTSATIQLSMGDLVDGTKDIGRQNFTGIVTSLGNSLGSIGNLTGGSYNFSGSHIIYTKQANTIGTWTGSLAIEGTIPAGTPSGEYTGELNIIICEGCKPIKDKKNLD